MFLRAFVVKADSSMRWRARNLGSAADAAEAEVVGGACGGCRGDTIAVSVASMPMAKQLHSAAARRTNQPSAQPMSTFRAS